MRSKSMVIALLFALTGAQAVHGAFEHPIGSVLSFARAGSVNLYRSSPLDLYVNPAVRVDRKISADLSWSRLYNMSDFQLASGAASVNHRGLSVGIGTTQLAGAEYYWERSYLLAGSMALPYHLGVGASVNRLCVEYGEGYSGLSMTALNIGLVCHLRETLIVGLAARNINQPHYESGSQSLPLIGEFSVSYVFSDAFSFHLTHHLEEKVRDRFVFGQDINVTKELSLCLGIATDPTEFGGGFSLAIRSLTFDYGFRDNVYLGGTHRLGLRYVH